MKAALRSRGGTGGRADSFDVFFGTGDLSPVPTRSAPRPSLPMAAIREPPEHGAVPVHSAPEGVEVFSLDTPRPMVAQSLADSPQNIITATSPQSERIPEEYSLQ